MNAIAYYRFSSNNQHEESIEEQQEVVRQYAAKNDIVIIKEYIDRAESATSDDRPNFRLMTSEISSGIFSPNLLLVHKTNRFARNSYDAVVYKHELSKKHVKVVAVTQPISDGPEGIILERLYEALDEYYSANLSIEVKTKMKQHAKKAKHLGGIPPLGLDVYLDDDTRRYKTNEPEAEIVKTIFSMYLSGNNYNKIIDHLNQNNYKTKLGRPFKKTSLYEILKNEKYTGTYVYNKTISKNNGKRNNHAQKDDDQIIKVPDALPVIIQPEDFNKVKGMMEKRKLAPSANKAKEIYLLTGLIYCGKCGGVMVGNRARQGRNKQVHAYYECNNRKRYKNCSTKSLNKNQIETHVIEQLIKTIFVEKNIPKLVEILNKAYNESLNKNETQFTHAKSELKKVQEKIDNIIKAISDGLYNPSMKTAMTELEHQKESLSNVISEHEKKNNQKLTEKIILDYIKKDKENIHSADLQEKKNILASYIKQICIFEDTVEIDFFFGF